MNVKCSCGCERELNRARFKANTSGLYFLNTQHAGAYRTEVYLRDMCGDLLSVVKEYLDGYAANHYKSLTTIRRALCPLMLFLNERGILNLDRVSPKIITEYLLWAEEMEYKNASHDLTVLTGFFKWAATHGYHDTPNPVRPQFHGKRRPEYLPRPYTHAEMSLIWRLAEERGNSRTRAVISIGEEAGLRLGEICRL